MSWTQIILNEESEQQIDDNGLSFFSFTKYILSTINSAVLTLLAHSFRGSLILSLTPTQIRKKHQFVITLQQSYFIIILEPMKGGSDDEGSGESSDDEEDKDYYNQFDMDLSSL